jgi:hypothetical protein
MRAATLISLLALTACSHGASPDRNTAPPPASSAPKTQCGPVGSKCDPSDPPCICPDGQMCHGAICSGGVWTGVEVFPSR